MIDPGVRSNRKMMNQNRQVESEEAIAEALRRLANRQASRKYSANTQNVPIYQNTK